MSENKSLVTQDAIDFDAEEHPTQAVSEIPSADPLAVAQQAVLDTPPPSHSEPSNGSKSGEPEQIDLLRLPEDWEAKWKGMPSFAQKNLAPWFTLPVHFENRQDLEAFSKLVGHQVGLNTRSIWFPEAEIGRMVDKRFVDKPEDENIEVLDCE